MATSPAAFCTRSATPPKYRLTAPFSKDMTSVMTEAFAWAASLPAIVFMWRVGSTSTTAGASASNTDITVSAASSRTVPSGTEMRAILSATASGASPKETSTTSSAMVRAPAQSSRAASARSAITSAFIVVPPFDYRAALRAAANFSIAPSSEASMTSSLRSACSGALQDRTSRALS